MAINDQAARREKWFRAVREHISLMLNPDGSGKMPSFNPPFREPIWITSALYTGSQEYIDLANRIVSRYNDSPPASRPGEPGTHSGGDFNIFQSNVLAHQLHRFGHLASPAAREVMEHHARLVFRTRYGSRQCDYTVRGCNDNMSMSATLGHIMAGEALGDGDAIEHGVWMLKEFQRLLSRTAWLSEFNSTTYSPLSLVAMASIAEESSDPQIRQLALQIEERLWAEAILHYHPATKQFAGPQSRVYMVDLAGHVHTQHVLFWLAFGPEAIGRDPMQSYFHPDCQEVIHFQGNYFQNIAEYCDFIAAPLHVPDYLIPLVTQRHYPAILRGRSESASPYGGYHAGEVHTTTYMEEEFSLGTASRPWGAATSSTLLLTYKQRPQVKSFRNGGLAHARYHSGNVEYGAQERSQDGHFQGEQYIPTCGWFYTLQKNNVALLSATPAPDMLANQPTTSLRLAVVFPAHFGGILRNIIGNGPIHDGPVGESRTVEAVSVEAGEVFIHMQPLLPTVWPRQVALRFVCQNSYQLLEFINYEGLERSFSRQQLAWMLNGVVITVEPKDRAGRLDAFHRRNSACRVRDYINIHHRYLLFQREDVEFYLVYTMDPHGVQTESIDGRHRPTPMFESNQLDATKLPFVTGPVPRSEPHFPWNDHMSMLPWPNSWLVGSKGLLCEQPYVAPFLGSDPNADG